MTLEKAVPVAFNLLSNLTTITTKKELEFPIMLRQMTDKETKEYHLKKLSELIKKSLEKNPRQDKPSKEQERKIMEWMERVKRMEFR